MPNTMMSCDIACFQLSQVGQIPIGDATGGAVTHAGGDVDYTARDAWTEDCYKLHSDCKERCKIPCFKALKDVNEVFEFQDFAC